VCGGDFHGFQDLRYDMAWGHQVNIVASHLLKLKHRGCEFFGRALFAMALPTNLPVLAKDAAQAAPGEKDGAGAIPASQTILLTMMWTEGMNNGLLARAAYGAPDCLKPIDLTIAGAQVAIPHMLTRFFGALCQFA